MGRAKFDMDKMVDYFQKHNWRLYQNKDRRWVYEFQCKNCNRTRRCRLNSEVRYYLEIEKGAMCKVFLNSLVRRYKGLSGYIG